MASTIDAESGSEADPYQGLIDRARLAVVGEEELERADEEGFLHGNSHYQDLRGLTLEDLASAVDRETRLLGVLRDERDGAAETRFNESRAPDGDDESLWHLDLGVASATVAILCLGGHPYLSCNGGYFGATHACDRPQVRFYVQALDVSQLQALAALTGAVVCQSEDILILHAPDPEILLGFARAVLQNLRSTVDC